jgi:hypothetical protein
MLAHISGGKKLTLGKPRPAFDKETPTATKITGHALDRLLRLPIDENDLPLAFASAKAEYGSIKDGDTEIALTQQAYGGTDFAQPGQPSVYRASGFDLRGNGYQVQWAIKDGINPLHSWGEGEDEPEIVEEEDMCDWDSPESVTLTEEA